MIRQDLGIWLSVISHNRPMNVRSMTKLVGEATYYTKEGEVKWYKAAGAQRVVEVGLLCAARNRALKDAEAEGLVCVQLSDDLSRLCRVFEKRTKDISFREVILILRSEMQAAGSKLAGLAPTFNPFFANQTVRQRAFIVGDFMMIDGAELTFDENLRLKEDYDYTLQHIKKFGLVSRVDYLMAKFKHRTNFGGAVDYRNPERELCAIEYLKAKWGKHIGKNGRGETEIKLNI